jgi:hypothetical protein
MAKMEGEIRSFYESKTGVSLPPVGIGLLIILFYPESRWIAFLVFVLWPLLGAVAGESWSMFRKQDEFLQFNR